jgi:deoxyribonuclease I
MTIPSHMSRPQALATMLALGLCLCTSISQGRPEGDYFDALPLFWGKVYPDGGETLYCGNRFGADRGREINIEHILPMSWAMRKLGCRDRRLCRKKSPLFNQIESDMHNLYPALKKINHARSSYAYAEIDGERRRFAECDFEIDRRKHRVEPRPASRGNIARAMFYMHDRYGINIYKRQGELLKQWHQEDPPDEQERRRNNVIEQIQGSRNKFIDHPELAKELKF